VLTGVSIFSLFLLFISYARRKKFSSLFVFVMSSMIFLSVGSFSIRKLSLIVYEQVKSIRFHSVNNYLHKKYDCILHILKVHPLCDSFSLEKVSPFCVQSVTMHSYSFTPACLDILYNYNQPSCSSSTRAASNASVNWSE
jgi:hypothetical protein